VTGVSTGSGPTPAQRQQPAAPKRITVPMASPGAALWESTLGYSLIELYISGLVTFDPSGELGHRLAEAVPSRDNGLWKISSDSRKETTIHIKDGATWHDSTPLTTRDLMFGAAVGKEYPLNSNSFCAPSAQRAAIILA